MTLFLLSLTGIPPTAGFFAKAYVILAAVAGRWLADDPGRHRRAQRRGGRVLLPAGRGVHVHARAQRGEPAPVVIGRLMRTGLIVSAVLTVVFGLLPELLLPVVERAAKALTQ